MARRRNGTGARGSDESRAPRRRRIPAWVRPLAAVMAVAAFACGFAAAGLVAGLDHMVRARFEGVRFRVPSRVYGAPTILYPGLDWRRVDLRGALARLGYREADVAKSLPPGQYVWGGQRVRVHLRAFSHPSRPEPARDVVLRLDGNTIAEIRSVPSGEELGAVLLEPEPLGAYYGPAHEQRELVRLAELPPHLVDAVLAVEDQRFQTHSGIDFRRIAGALLANLRAGKIRQGGSTLTQQLVKNFFLTPERTLRRKLQEAAMALIVEARYEKDEILESYLNEIYLGQRGATAIHGVGEGSHLYFGKPASELGVAESALLAAIIQSPNGISPYRDPKRATERRNLVLDLMLQQQRLDPETHARAREEPLHLAAVTPDANDARYFLDLLRRQLAEVYPTEVLTQEGLRIYSTLDARLQRIAAESLRKGLESIEKRRPSLVGKADDGRLQGCIVAIRPQTGELLRSGRRPRLPLLAVRPLHAGASAGRQRVQAVRVRGGARAVSGSADHHAGEPARRHAARDEDAVGSVAPSQLTIAASTATSACGTRSSSRTTWRRRGSRSRSASPASRKSRRRLGIESPLPRVPSLALGTAEIAPLELARAYATLASGGVRPTTQTVEDVVDGEGNVMEKHRLRFERVLDAGTAFLATSLLEGVAERGTRAVTARRRSARADRRQDGDDRRGARPLVRRLHAGSRRRGVGRLRHAARARHSGQRRRAADLAAASSRARPAASCAAASRSRRSSRGRDRSGDGCARSEWMSREPRGVLPRGHAADGDLPRRRRRARRRSAALAAGSAVSRALQRARARACCSR